MCGAGTGPCGGSCRGHILKLLRAAPPDNPPSESTTPLSTEAPEALVEAISLFNRRYYWETHEVLEHVWMDETGPARKFYQGLIQASAALYHVLNANPKGVIRLAEEAQNKLQPYLPSYMEVPLEKLCVTLERYATEAREILGKHRVGFDYDGLPYLTIGEDMDVPASLRK